MTIRPLFAVAWGIAYHRPTRVLAVLPVPCVGLAFDFGIRVRQTKARPPVTDAERDDKVGNLLGAAGRAESGAVFALAVGDFPAAHKLRGKARGLRDAARDIDPGRAAPAWAADEAFEDRKENA